MGARNWCFSPVALSLRCYTHTAPNKNVPGCAARDVCFIMVRTPEKFASLLLRGLSYPVVGVTFLSNGLV